MRQQTGGARLRAPACSDCTDGTSMFNRKIDLVQIDLGDDNHDHLIDPDEVIRIAIAQAVGAAADGIRHSHQVAMRSESAGAGRIRRPIRASRPSGLALIFSVHGIFPPLVSSLK